MPLEQLGPKPGDDNLVQLLLDNKADVNAVDVVRILGSKP
jgi:hypothetical protein